MKKRYKVPLIIIACIMFLILASFAVKAIFPIKANPGFEYVMTNELIAELPKDSRHNFNEFMRWEYTEDGFIYCFMDNAVKKFDRNTGTLAASAPLSENDVPYTMRLLSDGNLIVQVSNTVTNKTPYDTFYEYTSDLTFLREIDTDLSFLLDLNKAAIVDDVIYTTEKINRGAAALYTLDRNLKVLTEEITYIKFDDGHVIFTATTCQDAEGKPFINWHTLPSMDTFEVEKVRNFISPFEANPESIIELHQYAEPCAGYDDYPVYVNSGNRKDFLTEFFGENNYGYGILGVKWDGTVKKFYTTNEHNSLYRTATLLRIGAGFDNGSEKVIDGDIYSLYVSGGDLYFSIAKRVFD
jgi:hypothetical protein